MKSKHKSEDENQVEQVGHEPEPDLTTPSKMATATNVYARLISENPQVSRKEVITRFTEECKLTPAGAATYYSTIKKRAANKI